MVKMAVWASDSVLGVYMEMKVIWSDKIGQ